MAPLVFRSAEANLPGVLHPSRIRGATKEYAILFGWDAAADHELGDGLLHPA